VRLLVLTEQYGAPKEEEDSMFNLATTTLCLAGVELFWYVQELAFGTVSASDNTIVLRHMLFYIELI